MNISIPWAILTSTLVNLGITSARLKERAGKKKSCDLSVKDLSVNSVIARVTVMVNGGATPRGAHSNPHDIVHGSGHHDHFTAYLITYQIKCRCLGDACVHIPEWFKHWLRPGWTICCVSCTLRLVPIQLGVLCLVVLVDSHFLPGAPCGF